jgi:uncharacterized protein (DUF2225 family)
MTILMLSVAAMTFSAAIMPAKAQTTATPNVQAAYEMAMKCFVAAGHAYLNRRDANDTARASYFNDKAQHDWNTAQHLSQQLGYSSARFEEDLTVVRERELPLMVNDPDYFSRAADECRVYGLM